MEKTKVAFPDYAPNTRVRYEGIYVFKDFLQQDEINLFYDNAVDEFLKTVNVGRFTTRVKKTSEKTNVPSRYFIAKHSITAFSQN